jgi:hypothetical protein
MSISLILAHPDPRSLNHTSNTQEERENTVFGDPLDGLWKACIFEFCGIPTVYRRMFRVVSRAAMISGAPGWPRCVRRWHAAFLLRAREEEICDIFFAYEGLRTWLGEAGQMIAAVSFGYLAESPPARPRKEVGEVTRWLEHTRRGV